MKIKYALVAAGIVSALAGAPAFAQADNTNSRIAQYPDGRTETRVLVYPDGTTQEVYIDREHRHWYGNGRHRGTWVEEHNGVYGYEPNATRISAPNNYTNPTGNELRGQNGGGK